MKTKLTLALLTATLLVGCGKPITHKAMMNLQLTYPDYELWEIPNVQMDAVIMRSKKSGETALVYIGREGNVQSGPYSVFPANK